MKVGIITFQLAWNCGAVLQAYALQTYLEQQGHEVVIINYRPRYKKYRYVRYANPVYSALKEVSPEEGAATNLKRMVKKFGRTILNYRKGSEHLRQYQGFREFGEKYLHLSRVYESIEELRREPPACDVYISGSDQLWNPKLTNGALDPAYFLDFGGKKTGKITYAISACEFDTARWGKQLREYSRRIDRISLREREGRASIEALTGKPVAICPDPTFLPDVSVYERFKLAAVLPVQDYILVYLLADSTGDTSALTQIGEVSKQLGKRVLVLSGPRHWPFAVEQIRGVCPEEFVWYIRNASFVICNSFHATVFSILFGKQFVTLSFKNRNSRMNELLGSLGLEDRFVQNREEMLQTLRTDIDYESVGQGLAELRGKGVKYLKESI